MNDPPPLLAAEIGAARLEICVADITTLKVDAIVNAANRSLLGGGGVDGAIHRAAGPELLAECENLGGCATGSAKISRGYRLPARHVIHAVGPVWSGGGAARRGVAGVLLSHGARPGGGPPPGSLAFPAISTGIYRFPADRAARIAVGTVASELAASPRGIDARCFLLLFTRQRGPSRNRLRRPWLGLELSALRERSMPHCNNRIDKSVSLLILCGDDLSRHTCGRELCCRARSTENSPLLSMM